MTIPSPLAGLTDLVSYTITLNGKQLPDTCKLSQLKVHKEVNRIASARITLYDGEPADSNFDLSEEAGFAPGNPIVISVGYHGIESVLFKGIIVKHGLRVREDRKSFLVLTCYDKALKLTQGRKSASLGKTDSEVMQSLIGAAGLEASVASTSAVHDGVVRYYATDWDYIVCRAEINGRIVLVDDGAVKVAAPVCSGEPVLLVQYGDTVQELEAEIDARNQYASVQCESWDFSAQKLAQASSSEPSVNEQGNLSGKTLAGVLDLPAFQLHSSTPVPDAELKVWADAQLLKSRLARLRGSVSFRGNAKPKPGCLIRLKGLGERFNGDAFVSRVTHRIENGDWVTDVGFGLAPGWFIGEAAEVAGPLAAGLLPGIQGLQNGVVKKIDQDPDGQTRVQVDVPMFGMDGEGVWARLASGYATNTGGIFFIPEVGDEVILGFLNGNPSFPIILGSLFSTRHAPPFTPDAPNTNKAIVTKNQLKVIMDDVKKCITIRTPGNHVITLNDDDGTVSIVDSNKNKMTFSSSGMVFDSPGDITIKATGNVNISAGAALAAKAGTELSAKAPNISATASMSLAMQGQATAELSSSGQTTVKAPMVMIN
jgi:Rhs element Vgr protein